MKNKGIKFRDWEAVNAQFRNSAGPLTVKKNKEERNACRDFRKNWRSYVPEDEDELQDEVVIDSDLSDEDSDSQA